VRILIVTQYFPPDMGAPAGRFFDFAQNWIAAGHEVTVVTGLPHFPAGVVQADYRGKLYHRERIGGVETHRCWVLTSSRGALGRPLSYASFLLSSTLCVLLARLRCDIVVATIPPPTAGFPGWVAARWRRVPLVLDLRDLWPAAIVQSGRLRNPLLIWAFERLAQFLYGRARAITTVTRGWKQQLEACAVPADKVHVLSNGVDLAAFDEAPEALPAAFAALDPDAHWITYAGIFNRPQGLDIVLSAIALLKQRSPEQYRQAQFVLVGEGPTEAELRQRCEASQLDRVVFVPRQPRAVIYALLKRSFALLVTLRPRKDSSTVPSKLYECMASGRPVLFQGAGEGAAMLQEARGGTVAAPGEATSLCEAIEGYLRDPAAADAHGQQGRLYVAKHFDRREIAEAFAELLTRNARAR